jgi:predicted dehydrogenase
MQRVGLIGCGNISGAYLNNNQVFPYLRIVKCADMRMEAATATAGKFGLEAVTVDALFQDPEIDIILNLTTPEAHTEIDLRALEAGKHVYSEKPFAVNRADGLKVLQSAQARGLRVGCAPDTFLGGGQQSCRKILDDGFIGKVTGGCAVMACPGHESWHPAPGFYYKRGGGPLMDMGPYYITALVNLLGPVRRVTAFTTRSSDLRQGLGVNHGKTFPVEVDTHIAAILEFASGAIINMTMSFDVHHLSEQMRNCIELWGIGGALRTPDPNNFSGTILFDRAGLTSGWATAENTFDYNSNMRLIGLADMAAAIEQGRPHRCSGELAYHVLDVMCSILEAGSTHSCITIESTCQRPAPLREGLAHGELD